MLMTSTASIFTGDTPPTTHRMNAWMHSQEIITLRHCAILEVQLALHLGNGELELTLPVLDFRVSDLMT